MTALSDRPDSHDRATTGRSKRPGYRTALLLVIVALGLWFTGWPPFAQSQPEVKTALTPANDSRLVYYGH